MSIIFGEAETAAFHFACTIPHKSLPKNRFKNPQRSVEDFKVILQERKGRNKRRNTKRRLGKRRNTRRRKEQEEEHREMEVTR